MLTRRAPPPPSPSPYREPGLVVRSPEGLEERRCGSVTIIDVRHHSGREATLWALASCAAPCLVALASWWRGTATLAESAVLGLAGSILTFLIARTSAMRRGSRLEILADGVVANEVKHRFADFAHFEVVPDRGIRSGRRRLVSRSRTGEDVTVLAGLLPSHAEYLSARLAEAAETALRRLRVDTDDDDDARGPPSRESQDPAATDDAENASAEPIDSANAFQWSRCVSHAVTVMAIYYIDAIFLTQGALAAIATFVGVIVGLVNLFRGIVSPARWRLLYGPGVGLLYVLMMAAVVHTIRVGNETAQARADQLVSALKHYRADHGRFPAQLDDLVPRYIPAVPRAKDGAMLGDFVYLYGAGARGTLWWTRMPFSLRIYDLERGTWSNFAD